MSIALWPDTVPLPDAAGPGRAERPMRVLVADDDPLERTLLTSVLGAAGFETIVAADGGAAWALVQRERPPVAIVDWMMPVLDGPDLCRRIRSDAESAGTYVILLTSKDSTDDLIAGLDAGADDYVTKPFNPGELRARIHVGARVASIQRRFMDKVADLQHALSQIQQLEGLLPICSYCRRIRSDDDQWKSLEAYVAARSNTEFTHGVCPSCLETVLRELDALSPRP